MSLHNTHASILSLPSFSRESPGRPQRAKKMMIILMIRTKIVQNVIYTMESINHAFSISETLLPLYLK